MLPITVLALFLTLGVTQSGDDAQTAQDSTQLQVASAAQRLNINPQDAEQWAAFQAVSNKLERCLRRHLRPNDMHQLMQGRPLRVTLRRKAREAYRDCKPVLPQTYTAAIDEELND